MGNDGFLSARGQAKVELNAPTYNSWKDAFTLVNTNNKVHTKFVKDLNEI